MFEVNLFTPGISAPNTLYTLTNENTNTTAQFGAFIPWMLINRGPLSALVHPNTDDEYRDHTQRAVWLGTPWPLNSGILLRLKEEKEKKKKGAEKVDSNAKVDL
jgi:aromatic ring-cleaving dioxygenase